MNPIAFVFALIALVGTIVAGVMFGQSLTQSSTQSSTVSLVNQVSSNVKSHYQPLASYNGITTATEIANGDIPPSDVSSGASTGNTPFGGSLAIAGPGNANGGTNNTFGITLSNIPKALCINLATQLTSFSTNSGSSVAGSTGIQAGPLTDTEAGTVCSASLNTVTWTFAYAQ